MPENQEGLDRQDAKGLYSLFKVQQNEQMATLSVAPELRADRIISHLAIPPALVAKTRDHIKKDALYPLLETLKDIAPTNTKLYEAFKLLLIRRFINPEETDPQLASALAKLSEDIGLDVAKEVADKFREALKRAFSSVALKLPIVVDPLLVTLNSTYDINIGGDHYKLDRKHLYEGLVVLTSYMESFKKSRERAGSNTPGSPLSMFSRLRSFSSGFDSQNKLADLDIGALLHKIEPLIEEYTNALRLHVERPIDNTQKIVRLRTEIKNIYTDIHTYLVHSKFEQATAQQIAELEPQRRAFEDSNAFHDYTDKLTNLTNRIFMLNAYRERFINTECAMKSFLNAILIAVPDAPAVSHRSRFNPFGRSLR